MRRQRGAPDSPLWWRRLFGADAREGKEPRPAAIPDRSPTSLAIAIGFAVVAATILMLRPQVVRYWPGQYAASDVVSRVDFAYRDPNVLARARERAWAEEPRVYRVVLTRENRPAEPPTDESGIIWDRLESELLSLPDRVAGRKYEQLDPTFRDALDAATLLRLQDLAGHFPRPAWDEAVRGFVAAIRAQDPLLLNPEVRDADAGKPVRLPGRGVVRVDERVFTPGSPQLASWLEPLAAGWFEDVLYPGVVRYTLGRVGATHEPDDLATAAARNAAADRVPPTAGLVQVKRNMPVIIAGDVDETDWRRLKAEDAAFRAWRGGSWREQLGLAIAAGLLTIGLAGYLWRYQPRIVRNPLRAGAIAALLLTMLALAQVTAVTGSRVYVFAVLPTVLVAMVLAIAYDQRTALGIGSVHAVFVTLAADERLGFLIVLEVGVVTACLLLDEVRTRGKLVETGGVTALAMTVASAADGLVSLDPWPYVIRNALYAAAAGLGAGFVVLGVLPFIERFFRITTSMTLLELADVSHPLLRKLALEASGSYNHSLQVATLAEEAAEAVGGDALLCRVAAYYHDIGKINKAEYFIENQGGGVNRHLNLTPSVSLLIIISHVKDGVELAREWNLPPRLIPFIQSHHGTTRVEYFYHQARSREEQKRQQSPELDWYEQVNEAQYRYPGPKPPSREVAILMLADACESACRTLAEPNAGRIETLVRDLSRKRLLDGQFDDCDLTMADLQRVEASLVRTLIGIYHGRIVYPSDEATAEPLKTPAAAQGPASGGVEGSATGLAKIA